MFFLFICHHMMNQKWTRNINKGKYSFLRIWQIILVIFLFLFMLGSMISGIILSRYVFKSIRIMGVAVLMENVHMICAYWGFVMMALHLGFHWNMFINMIKNKIEKWKKETGKEPVAHGIRAKLAEKKQEIQNEQKNKHHTRSQNKDRGAR